MDVITDFVLVGTAALGVASLVLGALVTGWRQWRDGARLWPLASEAEEARCREFIERAGARMFKA